MLRRMRERGVYAPEEFDEWLCGRGWGWQKLEAGDYGLSLEHALILFTCEDPVRWCETYMVEPRTGEPWRFFDYQKPSLRAWRQDVVHKDGAEVGKTREIVCMILWGQGTAMGFTVPRPGMLVGAPQQTHLDEIIMAVEEQVGAHGGETAKGTPISHMWKKPKRTPHTLHRFATPPLRGEAVGTGVVYYRPAGHDGEAFRGVHVNAMQLMDEAAKLTSAVQWSEFWRAGTPGCRKRVYSVPNGNRATEFYAMGQQAQIDLPLARDGWRLFHWPKTIMPPPYWDEARERDLVKLYRGKQTPGYVRNVLGEDGDAESPVFPWVTLLPNVVDVPEYRIIKLTADHERGDLAIEVMRCELTVHEGRKTGTDVWVGDTAVTLEGFIAQRDAQRRRNWQALLREHLAGETRGVFFGGGDLGETTDPTEIILSELRGKVLRDNLRLCVRGLPYHAQREMIYCLAELYGWLPHWGVDLGAAGSAVVKDLQSGDQYADAHFDENMTGYQFAGNVDFIGEDGTPLEQENSKGDEVTMRGPAKHWATVCITDRLQRNEYALAYDTETLNMMTSHTSRTVGNWPIYAKTHDHAIDARRVQMLRMLDDSEGVAPDVFLSAAIPRKAA